MYNICLLVSEINATRKQVFSVSFEHHANVFFWQMRGTASREHVTSFLEQKMRLSVQRDHGRLCVRFLWVWPLCSSSLGFFFSAWIINSSQPYMDLFHVCAEPLGRSWKHLYVDTPQLCHPFSSALSYLTSINASYELLTCWLMDHCSDLIHGARHAFIMEMDMSVDSN